MSTTESVNILGMKVVGQHGRDVGTITEVLIDLDTLSVSAIEVKLNLDVLEELELKRPLFGTQTVRIAASEVSGGADVFVLKSPLEDIEVSGGTPTREQTEQAGKLRSEQES